MIIIQVAIKLENGLICTLPRPKRHHHIINLLATSGCKTPIKGTQGFINSRGEFCDRELARKIAIDSGQVKEAEALHKRELFSEDLW